jgi:large subunit ribosomal protein L10
MPMRATKIQPSKAQAITELKTMIGASSDFIFTEYRGLTVEQISNLRKLLRAKNAEFHVVKNNFARIAFSELGFPTEVTPNLVGPVAVAFSKTEPNEIAKILVDFAKEAPLKVKGGVVDKDYLDGKAIDAFARLPSRNVLLSMFMSAMLSPVQKLVYTLVALQDKLAEGAPAPAAAPAAEAAPAAAEAAPEAPAQ